LGHGDQCGALSIVFHLAHITSPPSPTDTALAAVVRKSVLMAAAVL